MLELPDVNVLVALSLPQHVHHERAVAWWRNAERYAVTPFTETGLLRLLMTRAIAGAQLTFDAAREVVASISGNARAEFLADDASLLSPGFDTSAIRGAKQVTVAHLVALARKHGAQLVTLDARMPVSLGSEAAESITAI
jgi:toxin-antitoxin system PIN domain toxin